MKTRLIVTAALAGALLVPTAASAETLHGSPGNWKLCGTGTHTYMGLHANPNTSCALARGLDRELGQRWYATKTVRVYSPVTNRTYTLRQHRVDSQDSPYVVYRGGNGAAVAITS